MMRSLPWFLAWTLLLASCAKLGLGGHGTPVKGSAPFGGTAIPPKLKSANNELGIPVTPGGNVTKPPAGLSIMPEEDLKFTDPDTPDADLPELANILAAPKHGPWEDSETVAKQRAAREGKPLLIWFTDSAHSPMCKILSQELFAKQDFEKWAAENLVRLRVDANVQVTDSSLSLDEKETRIAEIKEYIARMKKTYKALGYPSLYLLNPSGEVIGRYRGYKRGDAELFWGQLKHGVDVSANAYKVWCAKLEQKGYRQWQDRSDRKVFAILSHYSNGTLVLIEPDGTRSRTQENKLSDKDRTWIAEQKKLRNLQ